MHLWRESEQRKKQKSGRGKMKGGEEKMKRAEEKITETRIGIKLREREIVNEV